jgi:CheY-like chemotaxis protein
MPGGGNPCAQGLITWKSVSQAGKNVLCIDDEEAALQLRKLLLESFGFSVLTASNGPDGIEIFKSQQVDAVLVDFAMPVMDGAVVAAEIKSLNPRTPVVMLTAYSSVSPAVGNVVDCFLVKGEDPAVVASRLESLSKIRSHQHAELDTPYVVFADSSRRYLDCSDGVVELLGYPRMELLGMTIEDISERSDRAHKLFEQFQKEGEQRGAYMLRHKTGIPIFIHYRSYAFPDGCLAAVWEPLRDWKQILHHATASTADPEEAGLTARAAIEFRMEELSNRQEQDREEWQALQEALAKLEQKPTKKTRTRRTA